jgi:hypothetical protein
VRGIESAVGSPSPEKPMRLESDVAHIRSAEQVVGIA